MYYSCYGLFTIKTAVQFLNTVSFSLQSGAQRPYHIGNMTQRLEIKKLHIFHTNTCIYLLIFITTVLINSTLLTYVSKIFHAYL